MSRLNHQRRVHFATQVQSKATLSRSEISTKEAAAVWYSHKERVKNVENCMKLVERRKAGKRPKRNNSYRGLEAFQECDYQELRQEIDACVYGVMLEQHRQRAEERCDCESFAAVSSKHSQRSREIALIRGKHDENEAKRILGEGEVEEDDHSSHSHSSLSSGASSFSSTMQGEFEKLGKVVIATSIESRFSDIRI